MTDLCLHFENQTAQQNGFWLSDWQVTDCDKTFIDVDGLPFNLAFTLEDTQLQLISQHQNRVQFLATKPVNESSLTNPNMVLKNHQAWSFLPTLTAPLNIDKPLVIIAKNQAIAMALYLCQQLKNDWNIRALLHSENGFPFAIKPARFLWPDAPAEAIGAATLLEDWHIPNRLCHTPFLPGCFDGSLDAFMAEWHLESASQVLDCNHFLIE